MSGVPVYRVRVDVKRRPTLPQELLDAAGVGVNSDVVARLEGPGRIVLEAPAMVLSRLQEAVRTGRDAREADPAATADELSGDRAADETGESAVFPPNHSDLEPEAGTEPDVGIGR